MDVVRLLWSWIPPSLQALADYYVCPGLRGFLCEPMNGQEFRQRMVREIFAAYGPEAVVETGTYRGSSTRFFAQLGHVRVHTVESHPRHHHFARYSLRDLDNVTLHLSDSRTMLRQLASDGTLDGKRLFFYLDAHWSEDLPLREEVELIREHWPSAVVMVDDFEVPGDGGYRFDDYGAGRRLTLEYLAEISGLRFFFPAAPSSQESGLRRGSVVLTSSPDTATLLGTIASLVSHPSERRARDDEREDQMSGRKVGFNG